MTLYENGACFATEGGQVVRDLDDIRGILQKFIDMSAKLEAKIKSVIHANGLALMITEWSICGTEPNGKPVNLMGRGTVVLRQESDGNWLVVIENPWRTA